ncbi:hypothetical protein KSS87_004685 [Heliosperma pusillum]|nr:hypothetical protein KSS87_001519 [Heliosperma pusillum]KAH9618757.1 hypothetical protein KSS87_021004 [Heliosperma pusillum]KAH9621110.1 hypothetical protein KSS87_004685 [Heliosperma pusillum]
MGENDDIDFDVRFPGQRYHSKDAPYNFRNSVDPRFAQSRIDMFFSSDSSDSDADESSGRVEVIFPTKKKKKKKRKLEGTCGDSNPGTGCGVMKSGPGESSNEEPAKLNIKPPFNSFKLESIELCSTKISAEEVARLIYNKNTPFKVRHKEMLKKDRKEWEDNKERIFRDMDIGCAKAAVEFYNKKHGTDYKIVETLGSYSAMFHGIIYHCNFRAERECVINSGRRPSPKLFFAELLNQLDSDSVKMCVILDSRDPCYRFPRACKMCPDLLWHPVNHVINSWIEEK